MDRRLQGGLRDDDLSAKAHDPDRPLETALGAGQEAIEARLKVIGMDEVTVVTQPPPEQMAQISKGAVQ